MKIFALACLLFISSLAHAVRVLEINNPNLGKTNTFISAGNHSADVFISGTDNPQRFKISISSTAAPTDCKKGAQLRDHGGKVHQIQLDDKLDYCEAVLPLQVLQGNILIRIPTAHSFIDVKFDTSDVDWKKIQNK